MAKKILMMLLFCHLTLVYAMSNQVETVVLSVPTMKCPLCKMTIRQVLEESEGVKYVAIQSADKSVLVKYNSSLITAEALAQATTDSGYPATIKEQHK